MFILNWEELRSPARATFKNPKISWLIGKNLYRKTNTKNPNFESMDELGKFDLSFTVENKVRNFHKIRLFCAYHRIFRIRKGCEYLYQLFDVLPK